MKKLFLLFILCITTIATKAQSGDAKGEYLNSVGCHFH